VDKWFDEPDATEDYLAAMYGKLRVLAALQVMELDVDGLERSEPSYAPPPTDTDAPQGGGTSAATYAHSLPRPEAEPQPQPRQRQRHRQRLAVLRALPAPDEAQRRVKRVAQYIHGANALRNRFVQDLTDKVKWDTANSRALVRCLDLVLQSVHFIVQACEGRADDGEDAIREETYVLAFDGAVDAGATHKQAREIARAIIAG
jgi:hypothetical protein